MLGRLLFCLIFVIGTLSNTYAEEIEDYFPNLEDLPPGYVLDLYLTPMNLTYM